MAVFSGYALSPMPRSASRFAKKLASRTFPGLFSRLQAVETEITSIVTEARKACETIKNLQDEIVDITVPEMTEELTAQVEALEDACRQPQSDYTRLRAEYDAAAIKRTDVRATCQETVSELGRHIVHGVTDISEFQYGAALARAYDQMKHRPKFPS